MLRPAEEEALASSLLLVVLVWWKLVGEEGGVDRVSSRCKSRRNCSTSWLCVLVLSRDTFSITCDCDCDVTVSVGGGRLVCRGNPH